MERKNKDDKRDAVITFKADAELDAALKNIYLTGRNRSDFIRDACNAALGRLCPTCNGLGVIKGRNDLEEQAHDE